MRPAQKSNRSRGRGNRKGGGGGNNINRVYDSAGPEGKVRGTPQQIIDKYLTLARDAQTSGDRVTAENFLQHAEHYQRILILAAAAQEQARPAQDGSEQGNRDTQEQQPGGDAAEAAVKPPSPTAQQPDAGVDAMATIDNGSGENPLLVDADAEPEPPKPNGDGRRRRRKPAEKTEAAPSGDDNTPAAQAEG